MKNLIWINWLINNPIVMWSILGIIILVPIITAIIFAIIIKITNRR